MNQFCIFQPLKTFFFISVPVQYLFEDFFSHYQESLCSNITETRKGLRVWGAKGAKAEKIAGKYSL